MQAEEWVDSIGTARTNYSVFARVALNKRTPMQSDVHRIDCRLYSVEPQDQSLGHEWTAGLAMYLNMFYIVPSYVPDTVALSPSLTLLLTYSATPTIYTLREPLSRLIPAAARWAIKAAEATQ